MPGYVGVRMGSGLVSMIAAATTYALFQLTGTQLVIIRKIGVFNHQGANVTVQIGYDTLAAVWTPVRPDILCLAGMDNVLEEAGLPICGNTPRGFQINTTAVVGFAGAIAARTSAAAAVPADVEIEIEFELIGS